MRTKKLVCLILALVMTIGVAALISVSGAVEQHEHLASSYVEPEADFEEILFVDDLLACPEFQAEFNAHALEVLGEDFINNQMTAMAAADLIRESFPVSRAGEIMYPESFGGIYVDEDGHLVMLVVGESTGAEDMLALGRTANVAVRFVEYSHTELLDVHQAIFNFLLENWQDEECPVVANICSAGVNTTQNLVSVYLRDAGIENVQLFESAVVSHSAIVFIEVLAYDPNLCYEPISAYVFEQDYIQPLNHITVRPGNAVLRSPNARQSMGFRATMARTGEMGFVTTMHGNLSLPTPVPHLRIGDNFYFGQITGSRRIGPVREVSAATDSAFVAVMPPNSIVNTNVADTSFNVASGIMRNPAEGQTVTRFSQGGTGSPVTSSGRIDYLHHIFNGSVGPVPTILAWYLSASGDSGGIILCTATRAPAGIHIGRTAARTSPTSDTISAFSHIVQIMDALRVTPS
ncbi:MAG: S1 family peptidase [Defluviitaleaceae bacterium]|nr:S1 family peptidase [Defluviitaleaceae bacterium]